MVNRRHFVKGIGAGIVLSIASCGGSSGGGSNAGSSTTTTTTTTTTPPVNTGSDSSDASAWYLPDESVPHSCTWMAFGAKPSIWGNTLLPAVQEDIALIARTLVEFEAVKMLVRPADQNRARNLCGADVELIVTNLDDIWLRDSGPVFVRNEIGELGGVDFNFNGWGNKQTHLHDAVLADFVTNAAEARHFPSSLVLEGGGIEVDGEGTAIITESSVLNANRNPGVSKAECEAELKRLLGLEKIIWLPGIAGRDLTDGHVDFYARFTQPGAVVAALETDPNQYDYQVTRRHLEVLRAATDAQGRALDISVLETPSYVRPDFDSVDFAAGYINYYVANDVLLLPEFGDAAMDERAALTLSESYPDRQVIALNIDAIAAGGGGIHCVTQQEPVHK